MFNVVTVLLTLLGVAGVYFLTFLILDLLKNRGGDNKDVGNPIVGFFIGFFTDICDTFGISSFAITTLLVKTTGFIKNDRLLPGTLNVGHAIPTIVEACLFIQAVEVEAVTLLSMIASAVCGSILGGRIVVKLPERKIQLFMGIALLGTAIIMIFKKIGWLALLGENNTALSLAGVCLVIGIVGNFILGALMMVGVGLYAPCLAMVSLLGMDPKAAFPIMMGSCAALMAVGSPKFIKEGLYPRKGILLFMAGGLLGVAVAYQFINSLSVDSLMWVVISVVIISGADMLRRGLAR